MKERSYILSEEEIDKIEEKIRQVGQEVIDLLCEKNRSYGGSAFSPIRIFSKLSPEEAVKIRIDDKLCRIIGGREDAFGEDAIKDLIGYLIILLTLRRMKNETENDSPDNPCDILRRM